MYLVHVRLHGPADVPLPEETGSLFACCAGSGDGLEHVSVHPEDPGGPVVGLFLTAPSLAAAELRAAALCARALAAHSRLAPFRTASCGAALIPDYGNSQAFLRHWTG
ncbi:hypothetical protein [Streptomyces sp. URMC 124]|uniref:hypothetical protein n=1 Tax=Streptomyces sp. URMC 124 TaxID=3423405 RepID=UPI003F19628F